MKTDLIEKAISYTMQSAKSVDECQEIFYGATAELAAIKVALQDKERQPVDAEQLQHLKAEIADLANELEHVSNDFCGNNRKEYAKQLRQLSEQAKEQAAPQQGNFVEKWNLLKAWLLKDKENGQGHKVMRALTLMEELEEAEQPAKTEAKEVCLCSSNKIGVITQVYPNCPIHGIRKE